MFWHHLHPTFKKFPNSWYDFRTWILPENVFLITDMIFMYLKKKKKKTPPGRFPILVQALCSNHESEGLRDLLNEEQGDEELLIS